MAEFPVTRVRIGNRFEYKSGVLEVDKDEILGLILRDKCIRTADLAVVYPGEKVRITGIRDIVEPRVKVRGKGQIFPGILGPVETVGEGRTHRLSGMAVLAAAEYHGTVRAGLGVERSAILEMWGPGADASRFSSLIHLVLVLKLSEGLSDLEAHWAIQMAELQVARRLAETTAHLTPPAIEIYDLEESDPQLPRVALIQGCLTDSHRPHSGISYYGLPLRESLATVIHPNEILDGAIAVITTRTVAYYTITWDWQNHPLILGLYRNHSRNLNFAGVILERIQFESYQGKEVAAHTTAQLASKLGATGAVMSWLGSGNAFVEVMLTARACEQRNIKTTLITYEYGGKDGVDSPLLFYTPEANAVVTTGSRDRWIELPEPEHVVGPYDRIQILTYPGAPVVAAKSAISLDARDMIVGGVDNWGQLNWSCKIY